MGQGKSTSRILVVGMLDSVHLARWLEQFKDDKRLEFFLFPSSPQRRFHPIIQQLLKTSNFSRRFRTLPLVNFWALPAWLLAKVSRGFLDPRPLLLKRTLEREGSRVLHGVEIQNAGYMVAKALSSNLSSKRPRVVITNYGSDIFWFQRWPYHRQRIREVLALADFYSAECQRDVELARKFGFTGSVLPVHPNSGGLPDEVFQQVCLPPTGRTSIAVKGYQGWVGRASVALEAIESLARELSAFRIEIFSANLVTRLRAKLLQLRTGLDVRVWKKNAHQHGEMLELFGRSRIYLGLSESDGISTSMLEAMSMGAFPIQSAGACCDEWFKDSGIVISEIEPESVSQGILRGLEASLNPAYSQANRLNLMRRASKSAVTKLSKNFYSNVSA